MAEEFVHLHVHSAYSLLDGAGQVEELVQRAQAMEMRSLAITDHGAMYGVVPFYKACRTAGIKPIIGCEMYLTDGDYRERPSMREKKIYHQLLLAETVEGYQNLMRLTTEAHLRGFHYKPRIDRNLLRQYHKGIIATSSCLGGEIPQAILNGNLRHAKELLHEYLDIFGRDHFFLELQDHQMLEQQKVNLQLIEWSREFSIGLVATNDVHYTLQGDAEVHDCLLCIGTARKLSEEDRMRFPNDQFYLKTAEEMGRLFPHVPQALRNTVEIAGRCQVELPLGQRLLPHFPVPEGISSGTYLQQLCEKGVSWRYGDRITAEIESRLAYELRVIEQMGFQDYFLIVWDFVRFARDHQIAVGPGRGSAAGSLVAYVLGITDIDPIRFHLLFERFLNPERVTLPDIDIDFDDTRRDEVITYVKRKYGEDRVAQIITFGTMAPRAAIRDVGRVMSLPYQEVDRVAKLVPAAPGMTLERAFHHEPRLLQLRKEKEEVDRLLHVVDRVEGIPRHASTHAAGVVISRDPLTDTVPLQEGSQDVPLTQYSMETLEELGLLKMDFLGLRNLTVIERAKEWIRETQNKEVDFRDDSYGDEKTYQMLTRGETTGVFQLESAGMRRVLKELKPTHFEDLIAVLALYRPGPMEQIPRFIRAKHGLEKVTFPHPDLEEILSNTYGIIVYQEQIMQIAAKLAGFSLGEADLLRRAVGKKKKELLHEQREKFVSGAIAEGYPAEIGDQVYDLIVRFADYGFNRSHSAAYAMLAYQTAYLKANYPKAYFAALLSTVMGSQGKMAEYIEEARRLGVKILPPDVQKSGKGFRLEEEGVRFGLAAIKNVGRQAIHEIEKAREEEPFQDLFDLCDRVDLRICNRRVLESLILSGAMDSLSHHRAKKLNMLDEVLEKTGELQKHRLQNQLSLFEEMSDYISQLDHPYEDIPPYSLKEQLAYERELIGFYLSGHPLDEYQQVMDQYTTHAISKLIELPDHSKVRIAGMLSSMKQIQTKKGEAMAFVELEDKSGVVELVVFPKVYLASRHLLNEGAELFVIGKLNQQDESVKVLVDRFVALSDAKQKMIIQKRPSAESSSVAPDQNELLLQIPMTSERGQLLYQIKDVLTQFPGNTPVHLYYESEKRMVSLPVPSYGVELNTKLLEHLHDLLGEKSVRVKTKHIR
ncbi:DNA polymerase III subunit alpha [Risungbinella massiliensis]|uniref:DNA polymerase III subunit alpha n=1 Tax=Risungbinella massiliensis TaxID=1329796 RepID=UPI0005CBE51B|nr:DNA polymerase III subunit alpha [Risungbinella massiliensis]